MLKTKIVGISHYQDTLKECRIGDKLKLVREPNNQYSKYAIAIFTKNNKLLGYLNNMNNMKYAIDMDSGIELDCEIISITGEQRDIMGCNIAIYERITNTINFNDGYGKFELGAKFVSFKFQNQTITLSRQDLEKCYKHYMEYNVEKDK